MIPSVRLKPSAKSSRSAGGGPAGRRPPSPAGRPLHPGGNMKNPAMATADTVIATITDHPAAEVAIRNPAGAGRSRMQQSRLGVAVFAATFAAGLSLEGPARAAPSDPQGAVLTDASFAPYFF